MTNRTESEVLAAGVSIRKEDRSALSIFDKLKLSKEARTQGDKNYCSSNTIEK